MALLTVSVVGCSNSDSSSTTEAANRGGEVRGDSAAETEEEAANEWYGNADGTPVHLKFWAGIQPEYGYTELVNNFNKESKDKGIEVEYMMYTNDTSGNLQLETYLSSGGEVDVFIGYGNRTRLDPRVEAGLDLDLTDYLAEAGFDPSETFGAETISPFLYGENHDRFYGLPNKSECTSWMLINVDMFEEAGIEIPYNAEVDAELAKGYADMKEERSL